VSGNPIIESRLILVKGVILAKGST
jgi:hypothetical protein